MRRGQVATFMLHVQTMQQVYEIFHQFATTITLKYVLLTDQACKHVLSLLLSWQTVWAAYRQLERLKQLQWSWIIPLAFKGTAQNVVT